MPRSPGPTGKVTITLPKQMIRRINKKVADLRQTQAAEGAQPDMSISRLIYMACEAFIEPAEALGLPANEHEKDSK